MKHLSKFISIRKVNRSKKNRFFFKEMPRHLALFIIILLIITGCDKYKITSFEHTFSTLQNAKFKHPDTPTRKIYLVLPPGYNNPENIHKRYPTIYILHGFGSSYSSIKRIAEIVKDASEILYDSHQIKEMIVVIPHAGTSVCGVPDNLECGSFYRNSSVTANYKDYILDELIDLIDKEYRTIAKPSKRGVTGFSMGGYGAIMLTMESNVESFPLHGRFGSVASHSGLLSFELMLDVLANPPKWAVWWTKDYLMPAMEAAFSDGISLELQYNQETGEITKNPVVWNRWLKNDPLTYLNTHTTKIKNPLKDTFVYIDCGAGDELGLNDHARAFVDAVNNLGIESYPPDPIYALNLTDEDYINKIFTSHFLIELRVPESLKFHSRHFFQD